LGALSATLQRLSSSWLFSWQDADSDEMALSKMEMEQLFQIQSCSFPTEN